MHSQREDRWSLLNPDGKSLYERHRLTRLQNDPESKRKLEKLTELEDDTNQIEMAIINQLPGRDHIHIQNILHKV
jgi:hypothetical protein